MTDAKSHRMVLWLSFAAVYLIWGSTYLAIRIAEETLPTFSLGALRFLTAGILLYGLARWTGATRPTLPEWKTAAWVGILMSAAGNGGILYATHRMPSGLIAVCVSTIPLWLILLDRIAGARAPQNWNVWAGVGGGLAAVVVLLASARGLDGGRIPFGEAAVLLLTCISWAVASLYYRNSRVRTAPLLFSGMQMLVAGVTLLALALLRGETQEWAPERFGVHSLAALAYLTIFGSMLGFTAYTWLLRNVPTSKVATYAYVNPLVAIALGAMFSGERFTPIMMAAAVGVLASVALILTAQRTRKEARS